MPYNVVVLRELVKLGFEITVVHIFSKRKTPYSPPQMDNVRFIDEVEFNTKTLKEFALEYKPDLLFINDRTIYKYNATGVFMRKKLNIPVVGGSDTQWRGGRQWLNVLTSRFRHQRYFTHRLVSGVRQYEYAKKLGFKDHQISMNFYSADVNNFFKAELSRTKFNKKKNFLFVGRFAPVKGLKYLLEAWSLLKNRDGATLTLVGNGTEVDKTNLPEDVIIHDFMSQEKLIELANKSSCFVLPSIFEPWALVIHEFAAAGLPLIVTNACGATPHFAINNYNGKVINPGSVNELRDAMQSIIEEDPDTLYLFGKRSRELSKSITPELSAHSLISVLK